MRKLEDVTPDECRAQVLRALGSNQLFEVSGIGQWVMSAQVGQHYRQGRVFLAGDAANRFPPSGGLGPNTGVEDAENLLWKIATLVRGQAADNLLDSYDTECRPTAVRNCDQSMKNSRGKRDVEQAIGASPDKAEYARGIE